MALQKRIDEDLIAAMRAKDSTRLGVLRMLKAALKNVAIDKAGAGGELEDSEAVAVVRKLSPTPSGYPRRVGLAKSRPLGGA